MVVSTIAGGHYRDLRVGRLRRYWGAADKRRIVAETLVPGASVSAVARRHDVNANLVFKWLRDDRFAAGAVEPARLVPVELTAEPVAVRSDERDGRIEIRVRGGHRVVVSGSFDPDAVARLVRGLSG